MSSPAHLIPAEYLHGLLRSLPDTGEVDPVLMEALRLPEARVPPDLMAEVLQRLARHTGRPDLGVLMGSQIRIDRHPLMGQLLRSARHLGEGLALLQPYLPLLTPNFHLHVRHRPDTLVLEWQLHGRLVPHHRTTALECIAAATAVSLRGLFPRERLPLHVTLPVGPACQASALSGLPDVTVTCRLERPGEPMEVALPAWAADLPLPPRPSASPHDPQGDCHLGLTQLTALMTWRDWVAYLLGRVTDHQPGLPEVAALLAMAPRTLARHLAREGTTFRALSNAIRHERARSLLQRPAAKVSDIARVLGYTDSANFTRAFRSAEGCSPVEYRRRPLNPTTP